MFVVKNRNDIIKSAIDCLKNSDLKGFEKILEDNPAIRPSTVANYSGKTFFNLVLGLNKSVPNRHSFLKPYIKSMMESSNSFGLGDFKCLLDSIYDENSIDTFNFIVSNYKDNLKCLFEDKSSIKDLVLHSILSRIDSSIFMDKNQTESLDSVIKLSKEFCKFDTYKFSDFFDKECDISSLPSKKSTYDKTIRDENYSNNFRLMCTRTYKKNLKNIIKLFDDNDLNINENDSFYIIDSIESMLCEVVYEKDRPEHAKKINNIIDVFYRLNESSSKDLNDKLSLSISTSRDSFNLETYAYNLSTVNGADFIESNTANQQPLSVIQNEKGEKSELNRAELLLYFHKNLNITSESALLTIKELSKMDISPDFDTEYDGLSDNLHNNLFMCVSNNENFINYLIDKVDVSSDFIKEMYMFSVENGKPKIFTCLNNKCNCEDLFSKIPTLNNYDSQKDYILDYMDRNKDQENIGDYEKIEIAIEISNRKKEAKSLNSRPAMRL